MFPFLFWLTRAPRPYRRSSGLLNVELFGILSNRQAAAQQKRIEGTPQVASAVPTRELSEVKPPAPTTKEIASAVAEPLVPKAEPITSESTAVRLPQASQTASDTSHTVGRGVPSRPGGDSNQVQQFLGKSNAETDLKKAYVVQLHRLVDAHHPAYPNEAKKKGLEGVSEVSFVVTASGEIKPNTLRITKSSGYAILDSSAMKQVMRLAPFPKPPCELSISFPVEFSADR
jgi:protein TonB